VLSKEADAGNNGGMEYFKGLRLILFSTYLLPPDANGDVDIFRWHD